MALKLNELTVTNAINGSITGNAATATTTDNINGRAFYNRDSGNSLAQDSYSNNGVGYVTGVSLYGQNDGGMYASAYSTNWIHQIYGDFRTGQIAIRGKNNGTWQSWRRVLDETNASYAWNMNQNVRTTDSPSFSALTLTNQGSGGFLTMPGSATFSNVSSGDLVIRNLSQLRFTSSNDWDWNSWAGIKYDKTATTLYIGGPAATTVFTSNASPPNVAISFVGTSSVSSNSNFIAPNIKASTSGDTAYVTINTTATANKRARLQFTQNDNAGMELGVDYSVNNANNFYLYDRVNTTAFALFSSATTWFNGSVGVGNAQSPTTKLQIGTGTPTAATDGIQFGDDTSARIYRTGSGTLTMGGTFAATTLTTADGSVSAPSHTFASDTDTGMYRYANNILGMAAGGVLGFAMSTTAMSTILPYLFVGGMTAWNTTTPGTTKGFLHLGDASSTANSGVGITWGARDVDSGTTAQAGIYVVTDGSYGTKMYFATTNNYTTGAQMAMRIEHTGDVIFSRGNVGVGTSPAYKLDVNGACHATSFPTSSDVRFKKNIKPIQNSLEKIKNINGVTYEWNEFIHARRDGYELNVPIVGVIAQDLEKVLPEVVSKWNLSEDCPDARAVDYVRIVPVLIEAIKELNNKNSILEARVLALENKQ